MAVEQWGSSRRGLGPVAGEALALIVTLVLSIVLVALLVYSPRTLFGVLIPRGGTSMELSEPGVGSYLRGVGEYLGDLLRGNLGEDARGRPVSRLVLPAARRSFELLIVSVAVALPLGLAWGAAMATVKNRRPAAILFGLNTLVMSLPAFVILLLTQETIATTTMRTGVRLTYVQGYGLDRHLILPAGVLALRGASYMARAVQVAQEDVMRQDWLRAARAKGLGGFALWRRHVLPALRLPLLGAGFAMLRVIISGIIIVDFMVGWTGLGRQMLDVRQGAVSAGDNAIAASSAVMLVVFLVLIDAVGRYLTRWADPRSAMHGE